MWVCEIYLVHYLNSKGLCCAPLTCVVHHRLVFCTMVHKGDLCPQKVGFVPDIFHFCCCIFVVDNVHINQGSQSSSLPMYTKGSAQWSFVLKCTRRFYMFVISSIRDGTRYDVVSLEGFLGSMLCTTAMVQSYVMHIKLHCAYWPVLCNKDLDWFWLAYITHKPVLKVGLH